MIWALKCNTNNATKGVNFNDIYADDGGNLQVVYGIEALEQLVTQALWLWYGEYDYDTSVGVTYNRLFATDGRTRNTLFNVQIIKAVKSVNEYLNDAQLAEYGIADVVINRYSIDREERILSIDMLITLNSTKTILFKL